jgi:hypothetical protein
MSGAGGHALAVASTRQATRYSSASSASSSSVTSARGRGRATQGGGARRARPADRSAQPRPPAVWRCSNGVTRPGCANGTCRRDNCGRPGANRRQPNVGRNRPSVLDTWLLVGRRRRLPAARPAGIDRSDAPAQAAIEGRWSRSEFPWLLSSRVAARSAPALRPCLV